MNNDPSVGKKSSSIVGYLLGAFAAASYGMNPLFALPLMRAGIDAESVLFYRYLFAIPLLAIMMIARGRGFGIRRNQWIPLVLMGLIMAYSSLSLYLAYNYIGASIASTLLFVYPILVTIIMAVAYKEKASPLTVFCMLLATVGIGLLYKGDNGATLNLTGVFIIFTSAIAYAIYLVACSRPLLKEIPTLKLTFYVIVFGLFLFVPFFNVSSIHILNTHWYLWLDAFGLALFPTALSLLATSAAIQRVGSTPVAIMGALEPVTAIAIAVVIFNEHITSRILFGMVLIIVAVTMIISSGRTRHTTNKKGNE